MDKMGKVMIPEESEEFQQFRKEIIDRLGLTWEDWIWLWDKISMNRQLFEPRSVSVKLLSNAEVVAELERHNIRDPLFSYRACFRYGYEYAFKGGRNEY